MRRAILITLCAFILLTGVARSANDDTFRHYFNDETLRVDYYHVGNALEELVAIDRMYRTAGWAGSTRNLIDPLNQGKYFIKVYDAGGEKLLFSRGYNTIFEEYQTTKPALQGEKKVYHESVLIPFPRDKIIIALESRGKDQKLKEIFRETIDPADIYIVSDLAPDPSINVVPLHTSGNPHDKVDVLLVAEGYKKEHQVKFQRDCKKLVQLFFKQEPYKRNKDRFNFRGVFKPSQESGCNEPGFALFKNTAVGCSFDALGSERYMLTENNRALRDICSHAPYDAIIILVNTTRYGGGGIYNLYATCISDNHWTPYIFLHEFGHSFAGLADEYYTSSVEFDDFYPLDREPLAVNITALLNPESLKWKHLVQKNTLLPTPWDKEVFDKNDFKYQDQREKTYKALQEARRSKASQLEIEKIEKERERLSLENARQVDSILTGSQNYGKVGAFEGAGYKTTGLYRPMIDCIMFSKGEKPFCKVCQDGLEKRILFYSR